MDLEVSLPKHVLEQSDSMRERRGQIGGDFSGSEGSNRRRIHNLWFLFSARGALSAMFPRLSGASIAICRGLATVRPISAILEPASQPSNESVKYLCTS